MSTFTIDMDKWINKASGNTDIVVRKIGLQLLNKVVMKTPVDTGRLRGNWFVSFNAPTSQYSDTASDRSGGVTIANGQSTLAGYRKGINSIYLTNNAPYAMRIETTGYSKQAPQGMARISVMEIAGQFR